MLRGRNDMPAHAETGIAPAGRNARSCDRPVAAWLAVVMIRLPHSNALFSAICDRERF